MTVRFQIIRVLVLGYCMTAPATPQEMRWVADGEAAGDRMGESVAWIGDIDGDGLHDILVGARDSDAGGSRSGLIRILSGSDGSLVRSTKGGWANGRFGHAVLGTEDVDGDGVSDYLVSATEATPYFDASGVVWLFSGRDGSTITTWTGNADDLLGYSVCHVGDSDGDGVDDFAMGAARGNYVLVLSGADASLIRRIDPSGWSPKFGRDITGPGDLDRDQLGDILIADRDTDTVTAYSIVTGVKLYAVSTKQEGMFLRYPLSGVGDLTGDGVPDFAVGTDSVSQGEVTIYSGENGTEYRTHHGSYERPFHWAIKEAGDVSGDGISDYLVSGLESMSLFSGASGRVLYDYRTPIHPESLGLSIDTRADAEGRQEFALGAPGRDVVGDEAGGAYVYTTNDFYLNSWPRDLGANDVVTLDMGEEAPGRPVALFLTEFDGTPFTMLLQVATLDSEGHHDVVGWIPPELVGIEMKFKAFVLDSNGKILDSGEETVTSQ